MSDQGEPYRAPRRLYLSRDKARVVEEGDPEAGFLLASAGAEVPEEEVARYGLRDLPDPAAPKEPKEPTAKQVKGPPADKAQDAPAPQGSLRGESPPPSRRSVRSGVPPRKDAT